MRLLVYVAAGALAGERQRRERHGGGREAQKARQRERTVSDEGGVYFLVVVVQVRWVSVQRQLRRQAERSERDGQAAEARVGDAGSAVGETESRQRDEGVEGGQMLVRQS